MMTVQPQRENILRTQAALVPVGWDWQLAHWITQIGSPPVMSLTGLLLVGYTLAQPLAWGWVALYGLLTVLVPALYVLRLYQQGIVTDIHLRIRAQRTRPLIVTLATAAAAYGLLRLGNAPPLLLALTAAGLGQTLIFFGITLYWKISAHTAAAAGLVVLTWAVGGASALPTLVIVPLIAWARIRLGDHTGWQTVTGALLGSLVLTISLLGIGG